MTITTTTPPASEPVTLAEALTHCRVDHHEDDVYLTGLISVAREYVERATGRVAMVSGFRQSIDCWPCDNVIRLMRGPLVAVSSITYVDYGGNVTTWPTGDYYVDADSESARIAPAPYTILPMIQPDRLNVLSVNFTAGYAGASLVPAGMKAAIKLLIHHFYSIRQPVVPGVVMAEVPMTVQHLINLHRLPAYF